MDIAALITWVITALGGFYLLGVWISRGGMRDPESSRLPRGVILAHFALAAAGLVVWIVYMATDEVALAWTAFGLLDPVVLLGIAMFLLWRPIVRARAAVPAGAPGAAGTPGTRVEAPERHFPLPVVLGHGAFAAVTFILVLITAIRAI